MRFSYRGCRGDFLFSFRFSLKPKRGLLITFPLLITLPRCSFRTSLSGVVVWGLGRSPNSKNLCASLCPLCGKTKLISHRGCARRAQRCFGLPSAVSCRVARPLATASRLGFASGNPTPSARAHLATETLRLRFGLKAGAIGFQFRLGWPTH